MKYTPISCNLYDRIESLSVTRKKVTITYFDEEKTEFKIAGLIEDIISFEGAEYIVIEKAKIRLDFIKSIIETN